MTLQMVQPPSTATASACDLAPSMTMRIACVRARVRVRVCVCMIVIESELVEMVMRVSACGRSPQHDDEPRLRVGDSRVGSYKEEGHLKREGEGREGEKTL